MIRLARKLQPAMLVLLASACGSTLPSSSAPTDGGPNELGRIPTSASSPQSTGPQTGGLADPTAPPPSGQAGALGQPADATGSEPTAAAGPGGGRAPSTSPGVTDTEIQIGVFHNDVAASNAFYEQLGAEDAITTDPRAQAQAIVDHINGDGGIAGRQVVPVYHQSGDISSAQSTQEQAACTHLTRDEPVFAAVQVNVGNLVFAPCMASARTPVVVDVFRNLFDQSDLESLADYVYQPAGIRAERVAAAWVDGLVSAGYFGESPRIGLIVYDLAPQQRVLENTIRPRLAEHGLSLTEVFAMSHVDSTADYSSGQSEMANAVLQFRSQNIDRVMFWATHGGGPSLFAMHADSQGYRPRYGLTTLEQPDLMSRESPSSQLIGAVAIGWVPSLDVREDVPSGNALAVRCDDILEQAGIPPRNQRDRSQALRLCGRLLFLKAALDRATVVSPEALADAVDQLGDAFQAPESLATMFGPGRPDGAAATRAALFDDGCTCFVYSGSSQPIA